MERHLGARRLDSLVNTIFPSTWSNACSGVTGHGFAVLDIAGDEPGHDEILPGGGYLAAEAIYAVRHEGTPSGGRAGPPDAYLHRDGGSRYGDAERVAASSPRSWAGVPTTSSTKSRPGTIASMPNSSPTMRDDQTADTERRKAIDGRGSSRPETSVDGPSPGRTLATMSSSFGTLFRVSTFGESHGGGVGVVIDGCPPRLPIDLSEIQFDLDRRRPGQSRLVTQRDEADQAEILSGVFEGYTTGTPIAIVVRNKDHNSGAYDHLRDVYRPSHGDFTYDKIRFPQLGRRRTRLSPRPSAGAAAAIARKLLAQVAGIGARMGRSGR